MLGAIELLVVAIMILAFAFPFRAYFKRHYIFIVGFGGGLLVGRIFYSILCSFFSFESGLVLIVLMLVFGSLFLDAFGEFIGKISQK
jgi:hypothetical protein